MLNIRFCSPLMSHWRSSPSRPKKPQRTWRWPSWRHARAPASCDARWAAVSPSPPLKRQRHDGIVSRWMLCLCDAHRVTSASLLKFKSSFMSPTLDLYSTTSSFYFLNLIWNSSSSFIRWPLFVPPTCSKSTGSSCLCGLSRLQAPRETWRQWRSILAHSLSRRSSWWR